MKTSKVSYLVKEFNKAKKKYFIAEKKISNPVMKVEFKNRCMKRFEELMLEGNVNFPSFYKDCFHGIYVDLCRKGQNYRETCSLKEDVPAFGSSLTLLKFLQTSQEEELINNSLHLLPAEEQFVILLNNFIMMPMESVSLLIGKDQSTHSRRSCKARQIMKESIIKELENEASKI